MANDDAWQAGVDIATNKKDKQKQPKQQKASLNRKSSLSLSTK